MMRFSLLLCVELLLRVWLPRQAEAAIRALLEGPADGQAVAGVGIVRGWAFSDTAGISITQVMLLIDGVAETTVPYGGDRSDVADAFPQYPRDNTLNSGFGITFNYNRLPSTGLHQIGVEIKDSSGAQVTFIHTVTVVRPGDFEFLDLFDFSAATAELEGQDILLSGVRVRDKASQQAKLITVRLRWFTNIQSLGIIEAITLGPASSNGPAQSGPGASQISSPSLRAVFESPGDGGAVAGVSIIRGWAFATQGRSLRSVRLVLDGVSGPTIPCCSARDDVADVYPNEPNAQNSGFGLTFNYGRLEAGSRTVGVQMEDSAGDVYSLTHQVTVVRVERFEYIDLFDLSGATVAIDDKDLVIKGVQLRDQATQQTVFRILRFRWDLGSQAFLLVKETEDKELLFRDDFSDGNADGWKIEAGQWAVINGEFVETSDEQTHNIALHGPDVTDLQLTAQLRSTDDDDIGLVFHARNRDDFSLVVVNPQKNRVQLQKRVGGQLIILGEAVLPPISKGIPFEVSIRAQQERIEAFLNGRTVIDTTDPEVTTGRIGLYSRFNKYAAFDNVHLVTAESVKSIGGNMVYVDASNEGKTEDGLTEATAWGTIKEALADPRFQDSAGNTVLIKSGVYREQVDVLGRMSGIPGAFNTIRAADGAEVVVDGEKNTANARVECVLIHTGVSYVRVESLILRNAQHRGILVFESGPGEIVGNRIHDSGDSGIEFWFGAHNYEVVNNAIYRNDESGIILSQGSGDDPTRFRANQGIMVRNNLILANGPAGGDGILVRGDQPHTFTIYNNTIVNNASNGIVIELGAGTGDVRNNLVVANGRIGLKNLAGGTTSRDFNDLFANGATGTNNYDGPGGPGPNNLNTDPLFMNSAAGDFRLQADSPCIDAGDPALQFMDLNGTRDDMGAYGGPNALLVVPPLN